MENATKALLIAAAVLIAILIISLGLVVYTSSAETVNSANLSQQEVQAANEKFTRYNGEHKRGSEVNAMLQTVLTSNLNATSSNETNKLVSVSGAVTLDSSATSITSRADTSKLYTITVNYNSTDRGGLVDSITVTAE